MAPKDDDDSIKTTPAANVISNSATRDMAQRASEQNPFYAGNVEASSTTGTSMALTYSRKLGYRTKEQEELEGRLGVARQKREQYAVARQVYVQEVEQARLEQRKINEQALYQQIGSPESAIYKTATGTAQEFQRRFRGLAEHEVVLEQQIQKQQEFRGKIGYAYLESAMSRISSPESIRGDVARAANERNIRIASLLATQQPGYDPARAYSTASERLSTVYASMEELKVNRPEYLKTKEGAKELMALAKQEQGLIGQMGAAKGAEAVMHRRGVTFEQVYEQAAVNQYHAGLTSGGSREAAKMGAERGWTVGGKIKESKIIADIVDIETLKARQETSLLERTKGLSPEEAVKEGKPFADSINKFNKELGIAGDLLKKYNETQKETIQTIGKWATAGGAVGAGVSAITGAYRQYSYGVGLESQRTQTGYLGFANQQIQDNRSMYQGDIGAAVRVMTGMYGQAKARGVEIRDKEDIAAKGELVSDAITGVANTAATMASTAPLGPWVSGIATASKATEVIAGVGTQTYRIAQGVPQAQAGLSGMQSEMAYRMAAAQPKIDLMQKYQDTMMRTVGAFTGMGFQRAKPGDINTVDILKELGNLGLGEEQVGSTVSGAVRALGTYSSAGGVRAAARTGAKLQRAGVMGAEEYTQGVLGTLMGGGARSESEVKEILSKAIKAGFDGSVTANALLQSASAARQLMSGSALSGINIGGSIGNTLAQTMGFAGAGGVSKELRAAAAADILGERERLGSGAGLTLGNLSMMSALQRRGVTGLGATAVMNMSPKELEAITSGLRSNDPKRRAEAMQTINNRGLGDVFTQQNIGKKGWLSEIEATKRSQVVYNQTGFMGQATLSTEEYIRQSQLPEGERTQAYRGRTV